MPEKDHFALPAVLRRGLSNDAIDQVVALSVEHAHETLDRHIDYARPRSRSGHHSRRTVRGGHGTGVSPARRTWLVFDAVWFT
ncbi:hypothetical protein V2B23_29485 [Rhodococcus sp. 24CO]